MGEKQHLKRYSLHWTGRGGLPLSKVWEVRLNGAGQPIVCSNNPKTTKGIVTTVKWLWHDFPFLDYWMKLWRLFFRSIFQAAEMRYFLVAWIIKCIRWKILLKMQKYLRGAKHQAQNPTLFAFYTLTYISMKKKKNPRKTKFLGTSFLATAWSTHDSHRCPALLCLQKKFRPSVHFPPGHCNGLENPCSADKLTTPL